MIVLNQNNIQFSAYHCDCGEFSFNSADILTTVTCETATTLLIRYINHGKNPKRMNIRHRDTEIFCEKCSNFLGRMVITSSKTLAAFNDRIVKNVKYYLSLHEHPNQDRKDSIFKLN